LKEGRKGVLQKPETLENLGLINLMLGNAHTLQVIVVEGIDVEAVLGISGVKRATIHVALLVGPELSLHVVVVGRNVGGHVLVK
jgi:hypothetical protein